MIIGEIVGSAINESMENTLYIEVSFFSLSLNASIAYNTANIKYGIFKIITIIINRNGVIFVSSISEFLPIIGTNIKITIKILITKTIPIEIKNKNLLYFSIPIKYSFSVIIIIPPIVILHYSR